MLFQGHIVNYNCLQVSFILLALILRMWAFIFIATAEPGEQGLALGKLKHYKVHYSYQESVYVCRAGGGWRMNTHSLGCCKQPRIGLIFRVQKKLILTVFAFFFALMEQWNLEFLTPPFLLTLLFYIKSTFCETQMSSF